MKHSFDIDIAQAVGVNAALIYEHLKYYCDLKAEAGEDIYEGKAWVYYSFTKLNEKHPYMSRNQVRYAIEKLQEQGLIERRNDLNNFKYDHTCWWTVAREGVCENRTIRCVKTEQSDSSKITHQMCENRTIDSSKITHRCENNHTSNVQKSHNDTITSTITSNITSIKKEIEKKEPPKKVFTPPTVEDVRAYCKVKGFSIDPERFIDYYTANGWMVSKNKMKDWQATVRNWARHDKQRRKEAKPDIATGGNEFTKLLEEEGYL